MKKLAVLVLGLVASATAFSQSIQISQVQIDTVAVKKASVMTEWLEYELDSIVVDSITFEPIITSTTIDGEPAYFEAKDHGIVVWLSHISGKGFMTGIHLTDPTLYTITK